jgi:hypothetical protein
LACGPDCKVNLESLPQDSNCRNFSNLIQRPQAQQQDLSSLLTVADFLPKCASGMRVRDDKAVRLFPAIQTLHRLALTKAGTTKIATTIRKNVSKQYQAESNKRSARL